MADRRRRTVSQHQCDSGLWLQRVHPNAIVRARGRVTHSHTGSATRSVYYARVPAYFTHESLFSQFPRNVLCWVLFKKNVMHVWRGLMFNAFNSYSVNIVWNVSKRLFGAGFDNRSTWLQQISSSRWRLHEWVLWKFKAHPIFMHLLLD